MRHNMLVESTDVLTVMKEPYFEKFPNIFLYRGIEKDIREINFIPFRYRTRPLDTNVIIHDKINDMTSKTLGQPVRNLMFTYPSISEAKVYGHPYIIVPIGDNYELYYNPHVRDFTEDHRVGNKAVIIRLFDRVVDSLEPSHVFEQLNLNIPEEQQEKILNTLIGFSDHASTDGSHTDELKRYISQGIKDDSMFDSLDDQTTQKVIDSMVNAFNDMFYSFIEVIAEEYIKDIIKLNSESELIGTNSPEIMVYAPDGFYVVPYSFKEEFDLYSSLK